MENNIPKEWISMKVEEIGELIRGINYKKEEASNISKENYKPILRANNINIKINFDDLVYVPKENIKKEQYIKNGDIIFAMSSGSKHLVGKSAQIYFDYDGSFGAFCGLLRLIKNVENKYFAYFFQGNKYREFVSKIAKGTNINNLKREHILEFETHIPPLAEQKEIVKRIEELFSDLDNGVESLKKAKEQIKIYRQSVLKNAFEGKLTEKWREENPDKLESPEILLEKIKQAREEHYQKQMEEWEQKIKEWEEKGKEGKKPIKPRPPKLFSKLTEDDFEGISTLPFNWIWEKLGNITFLITDGTHLKPDYTEFGVPFLSVKNVRPNIIKDEDIKYISIEQHSEYIRRCKVEPRDILYTKVGATYGYAAINNLNYDFSIYVSLCLIKYPQQIILPKFISYCMNSKIIYNQAQKRIKGIGRPDLHLEEISEFYFPLVSIEEQQKIVIEIEDKMSVCDKMEEAIDEGLKKAELLRQSILKKAFSGELTKEWRKNNPDLITGENSAENLLKKIKAEKEAQK